MKNANINAKSVRIIVLIVLSVKRGFIEIIRFQTVGVCKAIMKF